MKGKEREAKYKTRTRAEQGRVETKVAKRISEETSRKMKQEEKSCEELRKIRK